MVSAHFIKCCILKQYLAPLILKHADMSFNIQTMSAHFSGTLKMYLILKKLLCMYTESVGKKT